MPPTIYRVNNCKHPYKKTHAKISTVEWGIQRSAGAPQRVLSVTADTFQP